jgi:hypothetical protein
MCSVQTRNSEHNSCSTSSLHRCITQCNCSNSERLETNALNCRMQQNCAGSCSASGLPLVYLGALQSDLRASHLSKFELFSCSLLLLLLLLPLPFIYLLSHLFLYSFIHSFILQSVLRQASSLFQSEFST